MITAQFSVRPLNYIYILSTDATLENARLLGVSYHGKKTTPQARERRLLIGCKAW